MRDGSDESRRQVAEACRRAAGAGKRVAVVFTADWCPDANALSAALGHSLVAPIVEPAFEVVPVDVGNRDRNLGLMADYGMRVEAGIPAVAVLEADGSLLAAQREGELRNARALSPVEIAEVFHRWRP